MPDNFLADHKVPTKYWPCLREVGKVCEFFLLHSLLPWHILTVLQVIEERNREAHESRVSFALFLQEEKEYGTGEFEKWSELFIYLYKETIDEIARFPGSEDM